MPFKSEKELEALREYLYPIVWPMLSDFENETWHLKGGTDKETTGLVYKGHHKMIGTIWKIEALLDISADEYFERFVKRGELAGWVPNLETYEIIEQSEGCDDWNVSYSVSKCLGIVSSRDFVSINFHKLLGDGSHFCMTFGVEHPDVPVKPGNVRGAYLPCGSILRPHKQDPSRCELYNIDLKGYIPRSLVNLIMTGFMVDFGAANIAKSAEIASAKKRD